MSSSALARDARIAGIGSEASLAAVHRRRSHLLFVLVVVLVGVCAATALAPLRPGAAPIDPSALQASVVGLAAAFVAYAIEKERALRRLQAALEHETRLLDAAADEGTRLQRLISAGHAITESLELDRVVELTLSGALRLFEAPGGALFLNRGDLVVQAIQGSAHRLDIADEQARAVAGKGEAALVSTSDDAPVGMAAPLFHLHELVGVLVVYGNETTAYDASALSMLKAFASNAGAGIANARLYRAEQATNREFSGLRDAREEFTWLTAAAG